MSSLILAHTRYQAIEQIRVPIGLLAGGLFPAIAMLAFAAPFVGDDPVASTRSLGSMMMIGAMSSALIALAINVAQDREQPWNPYLRTLPAGPLPHFAGRLLSSMALMVISTIPVTVVAGLFTEADLSPGRLAVMVAAVLVGSLPFMLMGLFVGLVMPSKGAIAVSQVLFFPFAIVGGLMLPPQAMPDFLNVISPYMPSRGGGELVWWAADGSAPSTLALVALAGWTVAAGVAAAWAYRRDEGRRFA
ncbi:ABC transporter permease [Nonomuraea sp. NPDC048826]|uniref:ABC transporter permease n=1 Tax=Nonomuraea sp. NPDC048826 TaxID=3364347 RepID=UPI00371BA3FD